MLERAEIHLLLCFRATIADAGVGVLALALALLLLETSPLWTRLERTHLAKLHPPFRC